MAKLYTPAAPPCGPPMRAGRVTDVEAATAGAVQWLARFVQVVEQQLSDRAWTAA